MTPIEALVGGIVQGLAQAAGERLLARKDNVCLSEITRQLRVLEDRSARDSEALRLALSIFLQLVQRTPGLSVDEDKLIFLPESGAPTVPAAILSLDREVTKLRDDLQRELGGQSGGPPNPGAFASLLDGLHEEVARARAGQS